MHDLPTPDRIAWMCRGHCARTERRARVRSGRMAGKATSEDDFEKDDDTSLSIGERLLRRAVILVPPRRWLYLGLFVTSAFADFPLVVSGAAALLDAMF